MTDPEDTARRSADAKRWAAAHLHELVGHPLADAEQALQSAGLRMKVVHPAGAMTLEFGIGRITVEVDEHDRVTGLHAG